MENTSGPSKASYSSSQPREVDELAASNHFEPPHHEGYGSLEESTASLLSPPLSPGAARGSKAQMTFRRRPNKADGRAEDRNGELHPDYDDDRLVPSPFNIMRIKVAFGIGCVLLLVT